MTAIVDVQGLTKAYGENFALHGLDLAWGGGGILGLLGPNGAGKTTLVEILEGLRAPTSGRVSVLGLDPARATRDLKERIGVQLQATAIPEGLTVREVVSLYAAFYRRSLPVARVLQAVDLEEKADAPTRFLSGGQRQRVALAMALVHDPELILLDEPTTGLDPVARRALYAIIQRLKGEGRSILLTTHYIEEAELLCDRVVVVRKGRIAADGTPFDLVGRASGVSTLWIAVDGTLDPAPLVAAGCVPSGSDGANGNGGGAASGGAGGSHSKFTTKDPTAAVLALGDVLRAQGLRLLDVRMKRPTLEDVYLELVGEEGRVDAEKENG